MVSASSDLWRFTPDGLYREESRLTPSQLIGSRSPPPPAVFHLPCPEMLTACR